MKLPVYNQSGQESGEQIELNSKIFDVQEMKPGLVHMVAVAQRANLRQGTAHTKTRADVRGGGKKPWRQKGTGRARAGSIRSPIWRGGGITFGPRADRNYTKKISKHTKRLGIFNVLTQRVKDRKLAVLDGLQLEKQKTRELNDKLKNFAKLLDAKKILVVLPAGNESLVRAAKNLVNINTIRADSINILDILNADGILVLKDSLPVIEKTYLANGKIRTAKGA